MVHLEGVDLHRDNVPMETRGHTLGYCRFTAAGGFGQSNDEDAFFKHGDAPAAPGFEPNDDSIRPSASSFVRRQSALSSAPLLSSEPPFSCPHSADFIVRNISGWTSH